MSDNTMNREFHEAQLAKIYEDIERSQVEREKLRAETAKVNKELRWYEVSMIVAVTLAIVAIAKLFL